MGERWGEGGKGRGKGGDGERRGERGRVGEGGGGRGGEVERTATCCVLLNPVEFVSELLPAYNPDVVVNVLPVETTQFRVMRLVSRNSREKHLLLSVERSLPTG